MSHCRRVHRLIVAAASAALGVGALAVAVHGPSAGPAKPAALQSRIVPRGYHLVWRDEFNGRGVSTKRWSVLHRSTFGDGNHELACLMDRPRNIGVRRGKLYIRAQREPRRVRCGRGDTRFPRGRRYTSAMITSQNKHAFKYGYVKIRAKLPTQPGTTKGLWPAFWLRPQVGSIGEIDVLEAIGSDSTYTAEAKRIHQTLWYDYLGTYPDQTNTYRFRSGSPSDGFHTYALKWGPWRIRWLIDGHVTYTRTRSTTPWITSAFNRPFYFRINMAVGGQWPGAPTSRTVFPQTYKVDYIRVYQR